MNAITLETTARDFLREIYDFGISTIIANEDGEQFTDMDVIFNQTFDRCHALCEKVMIEAGRLQATKGVV